MYNNNKDTKKKRSHEGLARAAVSALGEEVVSITEGQGLPAKEIKAFSDQVTDL